MIGKLFLLLLQAALPAGIFIAAVALLRGVIHSHRIFVVLWVIAGISLLVPVQIPSPFSVQNIGEIQKLTRDVIGGEENPANRKNLWEIDKMTEDISLPANSKPVQTGKAPHSNVLENQNKQEAGETAKKSDVGRTVPGGLPYTFLEALQVAGQVWLCGAVAILLWGLAGYIRLRLTVRDAVHLYENVWQSDRISTPFLFGIIRPRIFIPFQMADEKLSYVIAHERMHRKNWDHVIKLLWYFVLALYWFSPLVWMAYILLERDIELACDERVIVGMDEQGKVCYANALLEVSAGRKLLSSCPVAFGEVGVKMRIKNVLNYKKPALIASLLCACLCVVLVLVLLTGPISGSTATGKEDSQEEDTQQFEQDSTLQPEKEEENLTVSTEEMNTSEDIMESVTEVRDIAQLANHCDRVSFGETYLVDLNQDGTPETVSVSMKSYTDGYVDGEPWEVPMPELVIEGKTFGVDYLTEKLSVYMENPDMENYYFVDVDTSDAYVEIALFEDGPSNDPTTTFLRYADGELFLLGRISSSPLDTYTQIHGDGSIYALARCDLIQSDYAICEWRIEDGKIGEQLLDGKELEFQKLEKGEFLFYRERYEGDFPVTAKQDFDAFCGDDMTSSSKAAINSGARIGIYSFERAAGGFMRLNFFYTDEGEEEKSAWILVDENNPYRVQLPGKEVDSLEIFDNLSFFD